MLLKLDFVDIWISKIISVVSSVTYYIAQDSEEFGPIVPSRGLR